jgi:hypothetical protein
MWSGFSAVGDAGRAARASVATTPRARWLRRVMAAAGERAAAASARAERAMARARCRSSATVIARPTAAGLTAAGVAGT